MSTTAVLPKPDCIISSVSNSSVTHTNDSIDTPSVGSGVSKIVSESDDHDDDEDEAEIDASLAVEEEAMMSADLCKQQQNQHELEARVGNQCDIDFVAIMEEGDEGDIKVKVEENPTPCESLSLFPSTNDTQLEAEESVENEAQHENSSESLSQHNHPGRALMSQRTNSFSSNNTTVNKIRSRTLSIDIERCFDNLEDMSILHLSNDVGCPEEEPAVSESAINCSADSSLPPLSSAVPGETKHDTSNVSFSSEVVKSSLPLAEVFQRRDRGFSFEFFSFGMNPEELVPDSTPSHISSSAISREKPNESSVSFPDFITDTISSSVPDPIAASNANAYPLKRPRGDSIIFDPSSFGDGGIHEQNALSTLTSTVGETQQVVDDDEFAIMNTPGFANPDENGAIHDVENEPARYAPKRKLMHSNHASTNSSIMRTQQQHLTEDHFSNRNSMIMSGNLSQQQQLGHPPHAVVIDTTLVHRAPRRTALDNNPAGSQANQNISYTMELLNKDGRIGIYLPEERKLRIAKFHSKRKLRIWRKRIKYDCRKKLADSRPRIKGRFVRRSDMELD